MKNPLEVLKQKEAELKQREADVTELRLQLQALKAAIPLLIEDSDRKAAQEEKLKVEFP